MLLPKENENALGAGASLTSVTVTGSSDWSRSSWRTWRALSPSSTPRNSRPWASSAVYS